MTIRNTFIFLFHPKQEGGVEQRQNDNRSEFSGFERLPFGFHDKNNIFLLFKTIVTLHIILCNVMNLRCL